MTFDELRSITPYLAIKDASSAIEFYKQAFGAVEVSRITDTDGRVGHAEIHINGSPLYVSDESPEISVFSPHSLGGSPVMIVLEVEDADVLFDQAVLAGAKVDRPMQDAQDGSMRNGKLSDPFGHRWMVLMRK